MTRIIFSVASSSLLLVVWLALKFFFDIPERFLPSVHSVVRAITDIGSDLFAHTITTAIRILVGFISGVVVGGSLALAFYRLGILGFMMPSLHAMRAVPPVAIVPFFLMWFGFSEFGKFLLLALGLGVNIAVSSAVAIEQLHERDRILFRSFGVDPRSMIVEFWVPRLAEIMLPTLRFGLATTVALVTVAEMLGAQTGLGYLIQTSRATFSLNVILLATTLLALLTAIGDAALVRAWQQLVYWRS